MKRKEVPAEAALGGRGQLMSGRVILSHVQADALLRAQREGRRAAATSLDPGVSEVEVILEGDRVVLGHGVNLSLDTLREIARDQNACFLVEEGKGRKAQAFSEHTNLLYSLLPPTQPPRK